MLHAIIRQLLTWPLSQSDSFALRRRAGRDAAIFGAGLLASYIAFNPPAIELSYVFGGIFVLVVGMLVGRLLGILFP